MQTALVNGRRQPASKRTRLVAAGAAALACAAAVIAFAVPDGDDPARPANATPAPVIDARPLPSPSKAAERFHHRLGVESGATERSPK